MEHSLPLITTLAAAFGLALILGFIAERLKVPALVGYLNPDIEIVLRTHSAEESSLLRSEGLGAVFYGEEELARGMTQHILQRLAPTPEP
jgi:hypothetical protein